MRILVLGLGNVLLTDEGIGVHVIRRLQRCLRLPRSVRLLDGGTCGLTLLDDIMHCDHLLLVDCARLDAPAGTIRTLVDDEVPALLTQRISPHQIGLCDLLASAALLDATPQRITLIAIEPASTTLGTELSAIGAAACIAAAQRVRRLIEDLGIVVEPVANPCAS